MEKIPKYVLASGADSATLTEKVNELCGRGMSPFGSPLLIQNGGFVQAMVADLGGDATSRALGAIEVTLKEIRDELKKISTK